MGRRIRTKVPSELRYFFLGKKLYHLIKVKKYPNLCYVWDYEAQEQVVFMWSDVQRDAQRAFSIGQVADLLGVYKMTLIAWEGIGLIRKPILARGIGTAAKDDSFSGGVKWRWYSADDVLEIYDAIMDRYDGEPTVQLNNLVTKTELISKLNGTTVLYYKNEAGDFSPVWKAPDW